MDASTALRELQTEESNQNPYPLYAQLRADGGPVVTGGGYALVTSYAAADEVLRRSATFGVVSQYGHARAAGVAPAGPAPALQARHVSTLRPLVESCAREALGELFAAAEDEKRSSPAPDFMDKVGYRLPVAVICELLGVEREQRDRVSEWAAASTVQLEPFPAAEEIEAAQSMQRDMFEFFKSLVRSRSSDDLSEPELLANLAVVLIAGFATTAHLLGNAMALLLAHDDIHDRLRSEPELIPAFITEVLRYDAPVQLVTRTPLVSGDSLEIAGTAIEPGDLVVVLLGAAGRDPAAYPRPDEFDPFNRPSTAGLSFGVGPHYCLGAHLARLEAETLFQLLLSAPTKLAAAGPGRRRRRVRVALRGCTNLPVTAANSPHAKCVEFISQLVRQFPAMTEDYECHTWNNGGEVLPYLFVAMELMDAVVKAYLGDEEFVGLDWKAVLGYLDARFADADTAIRQLIVTSFILDLPYPGQPGCELVSHLGPLLAQQFAKHRPGG